MSRKYMVEMTDKNQSRTGAKSTKANKGKNSNNDNKNDKKGKHPLRALRTAFIIVLVAVLLIGSVVGGALLGFIDDSMDLLAAEYDMELSSIVYYTDEETGEAKEFDRLYSEQNRSWVDLADIPENLRNAFIAIEDERFEQHNGVDWKRTFGAFLGWITGNDSYGGSTITQQLIKNVTGDNDRSPIRKIQEIARALNLETKMSKDQIIEMYMNTIYLGQGCHGVQTAAKVYYNKDVSQLNLEECASIAGITQYPAKYDPLVNYEEHKKKQELVLGKMQELGYITKDEYETAKNAELKLRKGATKNTRIQSYFVDQVIEDVLDDLMARNNMTESDATKLIFKGGLKIYSTVSPTVQNAMETVFTDDSNFTGSGENKPEAAMLVMDPYTGYIRGIVGGRGEKTGNRVLNRATQTLRQPGSSIKPLSVYGPAIEAGVITPATIVDDLPLKIGDWEPRNSDRKFKGPITVRQALEESRNVPAVRILDKLSVNKSFEFLTKNLSMTTLVDSEKRKDGKTYSDKFYSSLGLGGLTDGVTVKEMTAAYSAFVNSGVYTKPITYTKVVDAKGRVLLENKPESHKAMSETTAYTMTRMLSGVVTSANGTGRAAQLASGVFAGGKTGTTSDKKDLWFVGFTPNYVGGVWYGYDKPKSISGSNPCPRVWKKVMDMIHKTADKKSIPVPSGMTQQTICQISGKIASEECIAQGTVRNDYFKVGSQPVSFCVSHTNETEPENAIDDQIEHSEDGLNENEPGSSTVNPPAEGDEILPEGTTNAQPSETESTNASTTDPIDDDFGWWDGEE
ncbi:MAG: PBP1A family penicillin-binding protein [Clostridia bacterium]|nr:PBP1A family penicillin-binding protein [Clostridia bacterium]